MTEMTDEDVFGGDANLTIRNLPSNASVSRLHQAALAGNTLVHFGGTSFEL
jgi:hypothetical protein